MVSGGLLNQRSMPVNSGAGAGAGTCPAFAPGEQPTPAMLRHSAVMIDFHMAQTPEGFDECLSTGDQTVASSTSTWPRVMREYGQVWWAISTSWRLMSSSRPGRLTFNFTASWYSSPLVLPSATSASTAASSGSLTFSLPAANCIAPRKQAE